MKKPNHIVSISSSDSHRFAKTVCKDCEEKQKVNKNILVTSRRIAVSPTFDGSFGVSFINCSCGENREHKFHTVEAMSPWCTAMLLKNSSYSGASVLGSMMGNKHLRTKVPEERGSEQAWFMSPAYSLLHVWDGKQTLCGMLPSSNRQKVWELCKDPDKAKKGKCPRCLHATTTNERT